MKYQYPNYKESTLSLISSILKYFKANPTHESLKEVDELLKKKPKNVVLILLDGLGSKQLKDNSLTGILNTNKIRDISSVFPSTTVAAITTLQTGLSPIEHAWLGWTLYFKEIDRYINIFPYSDPFSDTPIDSKVDMRDKIKYESVFYKINKAGLGVAYNVHPKNIKNNFCEEKYSVPVSSFEEMCSEIKNLCSQDGTKYVYAYYTEPDSTMHQTGTLSVETNGVIYEIEETIKNNLLELEDTLLIVTADHGHMDIKENIYIDEEKELFDCLEKYPFIEGRASSFFVKEGKREEFEKLFKEKFKDDFILLTKQQIIDMKLFGDGPIHPKSLDFIGDYMSIAIGEKYIVNTPRKEGFDPLVSMHAGLTTNEVVVPLIVFEYLKK